MINYIHPVFIFLQNYVLRGQERSIKAKKNILASILIKGCGIGISLLLVPLTINYVNPSRYGIWLTLSSIVAWFSFFDVGLTQGLRNKFAEAKATGDESGAQTYVSTSYVILGIIFTAIWLLFLVVNPFLNWASILNLSEEYASEVSTLALIVFTYFCIQFTLRIIITLIIADQQPAKSSLVDLIGQFLSLTIIAILVVTTEGSLIHLGLALCSAPLLVLLAANIFFFNGKYKSYKPKIAKVDFSYAKSLFNLGAVFFIIQIAGVIQFESANIIIARSFGPSDVTSYNIVYKYFGLLNMSFTIFLTPFWSAATEAYQKNDIRWIKNSIRKYNYLNVILIAVGSLMLIFSDTVYALWLGEGTVEIDFMLSVWAFIYFSISMFGAKYVSFLNGISALKLQFWSSLLSPILYIALAFIFIQHFKMGVYALFVASVFANFNAYALAPLQYHMIVIKKKRGVWIK